MFGHILAAVVFLLAFNVTAAPRQWVNPCIDEVKTAVEGKRFDRRSKALLENYPISVRVITKLSDGLYRVQAIQRDSETGDIKSDFFANVEATRQGRSCQVKPAILGTQGI